MPEFKKVVQHQYFGFLFLFILGLVLKIWTFPTLFLQNEMWAEGANNYYLFAETRAFWENIKSTDAGYLPILPRLVALAVKSVGISVQYIPLTYQGISFIFISLFCATPALPFFRRIISSDLSRILIHPFLTPCVN